MKSNNTFKKLAIYSTLGIGAMLAGFFSWQNYFSHRSGSIEERIESKGETTRGVVLGITDSLDQLVASGIEQSKSLTKTFSQTPLAGIIPHDIYMGDYIAHYFSELAKVSTPKTIILVGPDHFENGTRNLTTSNTLWETDYGIVESDSKIIKGLEQNDIAKIEPEVLKSEHSITAIVPFIERYFPDAKIVPIIFKAKTSQPEIMALREALEEVQDATVVGAIDFSHYLLPKQSDVNDVATAAALQKLDNNFFLSLKKNFNDYTDSPASVAFVINWAKSKGATYGDIVYHMNISEKTGLRNKPSTSYFEAIFY